MKFLLSLQICSAVLGQCSTPIDVRPLYQSHYDCASAGYLQSLKTIQNLGQVEVENNKIYVRFSCIELLNS